MQIKIIVLKSDVISAIAETTDYTGNKTETADREEFHERVATVENDAELLSRYWQEVCATLADALRSFITEALFGRETFTLTLELSSSYDTSLTPAVEAGIFSIICSSITWRWFRLTMPSRADEWKKEASCQFSALIANLYHRKKPIRQ